MGKVLKKEKEVFYPKEEQETDVVTLTLKQLNHYQLEVNRLLKRGHKVNSPSVMILQDKAYQFQRELLHYYDVIPVINDRTGLWELFT